MVIIAMLAAVAVGEWSRRSLARDVIPELGEPQIVVCAEWMGHPAVDVAERVTPVLTSTLRDVPGAVAIRATSMTGMAFVDLVFAADTDLGLRRKQLSDRLNAVRERLPATVRLQVGPEASSTGWVFQYVLIDPSDEMGMMLPELRRFQEDVLRPALQAIPGVAEVATVGGGVERLVVETRGADLRARGLAFSDVAAGISRALTDLRAMEVRDIEALPVTARGEAVRDVAKVRVVAEMPNGWTDVAGGPTGIGGIVVAKRNADATAIITSVNRVLDGARPSLPRGSRMLKVYDRSELASRVEHALVKALAQEIGLVVLVVLVFLLHGRSAVAPAVTLPVVVLLTFLGMRLAGLSATVMSLGGIAVVLGMAVDADLVALEACARQMSALPPGAARLVTPEERRRQLLVAANAVTPAILTSLLIAALAFLPVCAFAGETGRLLRPLAVTKTLVVIAAALVAVTLAPLLRDRLLRDPVRSEMDNPLARTLVRLYRPFVHFALERPVLTLAIAALALLSCVPLLPRLGGEFLPRIDEGDLLLMPTTRPGVGHEEAAALLARQDRAIRSRPEVATVFGKAGRADTATDPAPLSMVETTIRLKPRAEWPRVARTRWYSSWAPAPLKRLLGVAWPEETPLETAELIAWLDRATTFPGWTNAWTAPVRARIDMMATGVRTPVALRVASPDHPGVVALASRARALIERLPGVRSVAFEADTGETVVRYRADAEAMAGAGIEAPLADATAALITTDGRVGQVRFRGRPVAVAIAADAEQPSAAQALRDVTVRAAGGRGEVVPLGLLGQAAFARLPAALRTEAGQPVEILHIDLQPEVDLMDFVERGRQAVARAVGDGTLRLRPGEKLEWAGQYQLVQTTRRRLWIIVPLVLLSMMALLILQFRNVTEAAIVLCVVPFALVGSVWTLFLLRYPLSAPVWVGLLSVAGLAMQTGVVMVVYIDQAFHRRVRDGRLRTRQDIVAAHAEGTVRRLRPKVMTLTTMALGLLPLLWAGGDAAAGAEIMKRVAAPMLGGLLSSAFLTLEVLPVIYTIWRHRQLRRAEREGRTIADVVGYVPSWARQPD